MDEIRDILRLAGVGFEHHWPEGFERVLGASGRAAMVALAARPFDRNKYLKLRRIAIQNLARCV